MGFNFFPDEDNLKIEMQVSDNKAWQTFVNETLLKGNLIDGILLLTFNGNHVYSYGELSNLDEANFSQFVGIFDLASEEEENQFYQKGFVLTFKTGYHTSHQKFVIRKKTFHSVYAISKMNKCGMVVINLPFGILITSHRYPVTSAVASDFVEAAAGLLRM